MTSARPHPGRVAWWEAMAALGLVALLATTAPGPFVGAAVVVLAAWSLATRSSAPRLLLALAAALGGAAGGAAQWLIVDAGIQRRLGSDFVQMGGFSQHLSDGAVLGIMVVGLLALGVESGTPGAKARPRRRGVLPVGQREAPRAIVFVLVLIFVGVLGSGFATKPVGRPTRAFELRYVERRLDLLIERQSSHRDAAGRYAGTIEELGIDTTRGEAIGVSDFAGMQVVIEQAGVNGWTGSVAGSARVGPEYLIRCRAVVTGDDVEHSCWSPHLTGE